jgi:hypothetical protein
MKPISQNSHEPLGSTVITTTPAEGSPIMARMVLAIELPTQQHPISKTFADEIVLMR